MIILVLKLVFLVLVTTTRGQIIPDVDPISDDISYRSLHLRDISVFTELYPCDSRIVKPMEKRANSESTELVFMPKLMIGNIVPLVESGILVSAYGKNWSLLVYPKVVNDYYGKKILGSSYSRAGLSGRYTYSIFRVENGNHKFQFGRSPLFWGQSFDNTLLLSGLAPPFDFINYQFEVNKHIYSELLHGQLHSEEKDGRRIKRYIAGHQIKLISKPNFYFSFGEILIYTGENRSPELHYLNPFMPYFSIAYEGEQLLNDNRADSTYSYSDNDNQSIFLNFRYNHSNNFSIFGEMLIDEFQLDKNERDHALAFKVGVEGLLSLKKNIYYKFEVNKVGSMVYLHPGDFTNWANFDQPMGFKYGPDNITYDFEIISEISSNIFYYLNCSYIIHGKNEVLSAWYTKSESNRSFPSSPATKGFLIENIIMYKFNSNYIKATLAIADGYFSHSTISLDYQKVFSIKLF